MAARTIETRAIISAEDRTASAFASVVQRMAKMEEAARHAKAKIAEVNADKYLAGGTGRATRITEEHVATRRLAAENRNAQRAELAHLREVDRLTHRIEARRAALAIAGGFAAHETAHFAHRSLETYREFDKERRFGKAVMGISDADQADLVKQAIHMGATTKFNDIQVLESQRELAARGLNKEQILGMMGPAADLGQALDVSLPDAVKQLEGAIFGFKKNIETTGDATRSAQQTADLQVRAAKLSGMTPEDIRQLYKYGATPAQMSGVSEQFLLAFGGMSKKANMGGDEAGVAFRALMSAAQSPTRGAREALLANGLDYKNYQSKINSIPLDPFVRNVAAQYGVHLNDKAKGALSKVFSNPDMLNDPSKFTPGVTEALDGALGKKDAKSLKSIAGMANRFRSASGGGSDVNALLFDLMNKLPGNIKLANSIFGSKQGGRIANALGNPENLKKVTEILNGHSEGYAGKIANERMSGFDGAVSRFEGATKNLETALGRAFDANGKGGLLTGAADTMGRVVQALAEAPGSLQRLAVEAGAVASVFAGLKGAEALMGGFGLKGSAVALTEAARELMGAAASHKLGDVPLGGGTGPGRAAKALKAIPLLGTAVVAAEEATSLLEDYRKAHPEKFRGGAKAAHAYGLDAPGAPASGGRHFVYAPRRGSNGYWADDPPVPSLGAPIGRGGGLPTLAQKIAFDQPPPQKVLVEVTTSSALIQIVERLTTVTAQLQARAADTGPGGLGETGTHQ